MVRTLLSMLGVAVASTVMTALGTAPALAHAETDVGPYTVEIGFGTEPAFVGSPNSVEVIIHRTASGAGVDTAANSMNATIGFGSQTMPVSLEPNFEEDSGGSPGDYRGAFVPTQPGRYTIHVSGKIGGTPIDETFTSSSTTFDEVTDPSTIEFPTQNPSVTELNEKIDREIPRIQAAASAQAAAANDSASTAKTLAVIGIVVGVIGLAVGIVGITRGRRRAA
jgi:ABC-type antimicrobial peptide transport system permease subunit